MNLRELGRKSEFQVIDKALALAKALSGFLH